MTFKFQIAYKLPEWSDFGTHTIEAETAEEAEKRVRVMYPNRPDLIVDVGPATNWEMDLLRITHIGANPQEQAALLEIEPNQLSKYKSQGLLEQPEMGKVSQIPLRRLADFNMRERFKIKSWEKAA